MDKIKKTMQGLATSLGKINKLSLPATILIASIVLGGFYFGSQVNKQRSIERQQQIKIEQERQETEAKAEQDQRDYIAKRTKDCLAIYKAEGDKYSNVHSWSYIEPAEIVKKIYGVNLSALRHKDKCEIMYKDKDGETFSRYY